MYKHWKTIWISDVHLGSRGSQAQSLYNFLQSNTSDELYLVGDFIDFWKLQNRVYWSADFNEVVSLILHRAAIGTQVYLVPGNHDEYFRKYAGFSLGRIQIVEEKVHITADGRSILVVHGDKYDGITRYARWLALLGSWGYEILIRLNISINWVRKRLKMPYWSLSATIKKKVKQAVNFVTNFESALLHECEKGEYDAIICGHIHQPAVKQLDNITYYNCGDWVESCTALAEDEAGNIHLLDKEGRPWQKEL